MKISIIGGGSYGTTLAQVLSDNLHEPFIYDINEEFVDKINKKHTHPFFNMTIPQNIVASTNLKEVCDYSNIYVLAVPTKFMRDVIEKINHIIDKKVLFINCSKGIEPETSCLVSQIVKEAINQNFIKGYVVLSGPSHAEELILRKLTTFVSASTNIEDAVFVQNLFNNDSYLRVYTASDVIGVETSGAIKNAIAVVSGIASGMNLGENARAALISRGIKEIVAIVCALGGDKETVYGLTGIGDLIVTASSLNSRNFQAGLKIGQGEDINTVTKNSKMAIEGIRTIQAAHLIGEKYKLELPIIDIAYELLYNNLDLSSVINILLNRKLKAE